MSDKSGYSLVPGDGGRSSGLIRRRSVEEGDGFLDLSLGSFYNMPSSLADGGGFSAVARALFPAASLDASAVPSVVAASTAAPAGSAPAFALGLDSSAVPGDGSGHGHFLALATNALAAANQGQVVPAPALSVLPPLFASPVPTPAPVSVHGNANASATVPAASGSGSGATRAPRSGGSVAALSVGASSPSSAPPPQNKSAPRAQRGNITGRRRRRDGAGDDADADAAPTNGGESAPLFPWATGTACAHPTLAELFERGITSVEGEVRCKRCDAGKTVSYEIRVKFKELCRFIVGNAEGMHNRAPPEWMNPALPDCDNCGQKNSLRPVIADDERRINWIFLLLGQMLGLCTLAQLKHFCARTRQHRTGAKDRVLYLTYMELCNQLCPGVEVDMASDRKNRTRPFA